MGLVGRNGSGKTTLLRIAIGFLHPNSGSVRVFGLEPIEHEVAVKRRVGYVGDAPYSQNTRVSALVRLHRSLYPTWDDDLAKKLLGSWADSKRLLSTLSLGENRRVSLACALAHHPKLLLLDEPANGLDPGMRREFLELAIHSLSQDGSAILFSSHNMHELERVAERICMLEQGEVVLDEPLDDIKEKHGLNLEEVIVKLLRPS